MNQHPIPQNVTQYEFKLIGFMTLKQFGMLGGFLFFAFLITKVPLIPGIFTWPIAFSFALIGFAIAFVPFEERTLDVWLINFARAVYSPTQYIWRKQIIIPDFFNYSPKLKTNTQFLYQKSPKQLESFKQSINSPSKNSFDKKEEAAINKFGSLFKQTQIAQISKQTNTSPQIQQTIINQSPAGDKPRKIKTAPTRKQIQNILFQNQVKLAQKSLDSSTFEDSVATQTQNNAFQNLQKNINQTQQNNTQQFLIQKAPPITPPLDVKSLKTQKPERKKTVSPQFLSDLSMPVNSSAPNIIVGMTITRDEKLINNAIVEISDKNNIPVRAVKSNSLGQFFIATPVKNGQYTISTEHPQYNFDTIKIEARGEIIPPIKIVSNT